ncbi:synaptotagmin-15-like isoform X2 [Amphiura filiformis]|uniref:synaptotagmin-15-like isoform X2 n=1 Tax=Amphiura filiformis TaxID=82378 RepID=UPI003B2106B3
MQLNRNSREISRASHRRNADTMTAVPIAGIIVGSLCAAAVLAGLVFILYRVYRRKCGGRSKYERLGGNGLKGPAPAVQIDGKSLATPSLSLKAVPFTLPPVPASRERIGGFTYPPTSSPCRENPELDWKAAAADRRSSVTEQRRPSFSDRSPIAFDKDRRQSTCDDSGGRRDSLGGGSQCSDSTDGHEGGGGGSPINGRRTSITDSPAGAFVLGGLNPELYKLQDDDEETDFPENHVGRIWFAVEYELESERLVVSLIKARNLPSRVRGSVNQCDPLVKMFLLPEERRHLQSKVKRKTTNPKFDESFVFQVTFRALQQRTLRLSVYDVDRSKRHKLIGHALYPLKDLDYETHQKVVMWLDLEKECQEQQSSDLGDLHFSMCYNNGLERLNVVIIEAKGLKCLEGFGNVDSYAKVGLMSAGKMIKTKKTEIQKKTSNPTFNESFHFKVPNGNLDTISVSITMMQHAQAIKGDKPIGRVQVGGFMYSRGKELEHWNEMASNPKDTVANWHSLT